MMATPIGLRLGSSIEMSLSLNGDGGKRTLFSLTQGEPTLLGDGVRGGDGRE
jgi:hypothetical protein